MLLRRPPRQESQGRCYDLVRVRHRQQLQLYTHHEYLTIDTVRYTILCRDAHTAPHERTTDQFTSFTDSPSSTRSLVYIIYRLRAVHTLMALSLHLLDGCSGCPLGT